jgi:hypothetical protein
VRLATALAAAASAALGMILLSAPGSAAVLRMVVQSHADLGGKCLDIPNGHSVPGMRLRMWDCNKAPSQILVYDDQSLELKMGSMCVTSWGKGTAEDFVGLDRCDGSANQHWKMNAVQDYYQIIGVNGLCLNLRYAVKANNAPLQVYTCAPTDVASLWALIEAPQ